MSVHRICMLLFVTCLGKSLRRGHVRVVEVIGDSCSYGKHCSRIARYKKNLKALYLVHPTNFIKIMWNIFRPLIR